MSTDIRKTKVREIDEQASLFIVTNKKGVKHHTIEIDGFEEFSCLADAENEPENILKHYKKMKKEALL